MPSATVDMFYKKNDKQQDPLILSGDDDDDGLIVENTGKLDDKLLSEDEKPQNPKVHK